MCKAVTGVWLLLCLATTPAFAQYSEDCRLLAEKLAKVPGDMKVGELDLLKNCLSGLQRVIVLGEEPPPPAAPPPAPECPPPPPAEEKECPVCPEANSCPKQSVAPAAKDKARERDAPDRRPKMYIY